jgi:hypothetical protein
MTMIPVVPDRIVMGKPMPVPVVLPVAKPIDALLLPLLDRPAVPLRTITIPMMKPLLGGIKGALMCGMSRPRPAVPRPVVPVLLGREIKRVVPPIVVRLPARPVPLVLTVVAIALMTAILPVLPVPMKMSPQRPMWITSRLMKGILPRLGILPQITNQK